MRYHHQQQRRGMALFWTIGLLTVLMAVTALLAQAFVSAQRESRRRERRLQAELFAESAMSRVAAQLARDGKYDGELWQLTEEASGLPYPAQIQITMQSIVEQPKLRRAELLVRYGADPAQSVAIEREIRVSGVRP